MKNTQMWLAAGILLAGASLSAAQETRRPQDAATPPQGQTRQAGEATRKVQDRTRGVQDATGGVQDKTRGTQDAAKNVDQRAVADEMMLEVKKHSETIARINKLEAIYKKQGNREKLAEVEKLKGRENNRYGQAMAAAKRKIGQENYDAAMRRIEARRANQAKPKFVDTDGDGIPDKRATGQQNAERRANAQRQKAAEGQQATGEQNAQRRQNAARRKAAEGQNAGDGEQNAQRRKNAERQRAKEAQGTGGDQQGTGGPAKQRVRKQKVEGEQKGAGGQTRRTGGDDDGDGGAGTRRRTGGGGR